MARHFDLRKQLRLHDRNLLRQLFAGQEAMRDIEWDDLGRRNIEPLVAAWDSISDGRRHFQVVLQDVNELADPRGQKVIVDEMQWRCPKLVSEFATMRSPADKALWAYLNAREPFDQAAIFARAEALRGGKFANRWNSLPTDTVAITESNIGALEAAVRTHYWATELRGERCRVHHYPRPSGEQVFFAYLPDWPDKLLAFDADGNLTPREESYTFSNVFIWIPDEGALEIIARGGRRVQMPLRRAFCMAVMGIEVDDAEPIRAVYHLDHLLDPAFAFVTEGDDGIAAVRLRRIRIVPDVYVPAVEYLEPKFTETATMSEVRTAVQQLLGAYSLDRSQVSVTQVGIQVLFMSDGRRKPRSLTFNVSCPNTCDLKSKPDDVRAVGDRLIRRWEILRD